MKNLIYSIAIIGLVFTGCDSRPTQREALQKAVNEFNKKQTPLNTTTYHPREYTEIVTDTIISNTLEVKIKNYSLMDKAIKLENPDKAHRVFESEVEVLAASTSIFKTVINTGLFATKKDSHFWNRATLEHVWVNQELSSDKEVYLDVSFLNPVSKDFKLYRMSVDKNGNHYIRLIEETT